MGPEVAALLGVGGTALVLALAVGLVWFGWSCRTPEVDALTAERDAARLALDQHKARAAERATGARMDMERARHLASARARGDAAGVLQRFPAAPGSLAGESGDEADEGGGPVHDAG